VADHLDYDGFGILTETVSSYGDRYKYTAREFDIDAKLQFNVARYYDASTGRWLNEDPLEFQGRDGNLYRYVGNAPSIYVDPRGTERRFKAVPGQIYSIFRFYYKGRFYRTSDYLLASIRYHAIFGCTANGEARIQTQPVVASYEKNYGELALPQPSVVPTQSENGMKGYSVAISVDSFYTATGFWTSVGTGMGVGAGTGGAAGLYMFGPTPAAGAAGIVGGAVGGLFGIGYYFNQFDSWNARGTIQYNVFCHKDKANVWRVTTDHEHFSAFSSSSKVAVQGVIVYALVPNLNKVHGFDFNVWPGGINPP
jgi:RHS repeat-associated protein